MIGKLRGIVDSITEDHLIVDVGGVGYIAMCSANTLRHVPAVGQAVVLYIETHVREDHIHLYGFVDLREKEWFAVLTTVQGVGTRTALAILGVMTPDDISTALLSQDKTPFTRASGVGPKLAARLITELKDKAMVATDGVFATMGASAGSTKEAASKTAKAAATPGSDAVSALTNLGYSRQEAYLAIQRICAEQGDLSLSDLIRMGLKELTHG